MTRPPLIRQGEGPTHAAIRHHNERQAERTRLEQIQNLILEQPTTKQKGTLTGHRSPAGNEQRLRAIPVIAPGIPGTIPGTNPLHALLNKQRRTA